MNKEHYAPTALQKSTKPLTIGIIGDSIANDLGRGMVKLLEGNEKLKVIRFGKAATGLIRDDVYDWQRAARDFLRRTKLDIIAVVIGGNDRQSLFVKGRRLVRGTKPWIAEYNRRVAQFMKGLKAAHAKIYWVGLPVVSSERMNRDYKVLNGIFRAQANKHGITYVSTWETFADETGAYSSFGRGLDGVKRRLRKEDGLHFTVDGELRLAHRVAQAISQGLQSIN